MRASKTLPEFSGFKGRVYPGQLKPRWQKPEPRVSKFSLEWKQKGLCRRTDNKHLGAEIKPRQLIFVKPVKPVNPFNI